MGWMNNMIKKLSEMDRNESQDKLYNTIKQHQTAAVERYDSQVRKKRKEKELEQKNKRIGNFASLLGEDRLG